MTSRDLVLMVGNHSAMAADSLSTTASSRSALCRFRLVKTHGEKISQMGWNLEGGQESTQSSRPHQPPSPRPEENLPTRLAAPVACGGFWLAEG